MNDLLPYISEQLTWTLQSLGFFTAELYLAGLFLLVLITGLLFPKNGAAMCRIISVIGMVVILLWDGIHWYGAHSQQKIAIPLFNGMLLLDPTTANFKIVIDIISIFLLLYFPWDRQLKAHKKGLADLYAVVIAAILGCHLMVMSIHLLPVYLSIEFVSLASYILVAYKSENGISAGAGLKYVLFGAAASAVMLYGISLIYGLTGSGYISAQELRAANPVITGLALTLVLVGIGFKLSFVPMHFWVPDVYQGAATPITALLSTLPKIAGFALLINILRPFDGINWTGFDFRLAFSVIGVVTMVAGNFAAVTQKNVKRMLSYSSIGHTGFALIAIVCYTPEAIQSLVFYLLVYAMANIGALMLASYFANTTGAENMEDYRGFGFKLPTASICFVIVLISLTGLPATAGFIGKLLLFKSMYSVYQVTHNAWQMALLVTGAVTTVVSLFYYIKIPLFLFLRKGDDNHEYIISNKSLVVVAVIISIVTVGLGLFPDVVTRFL